MGTFYRVFVGALVLASTACATLDHFQYWEVGKGPFPVGPEWTEIHCPDPIAATGQNQRLYLLTPVGSDVPNFHDKVIVFDKDGKRVELHAEVIDTEGRVYPLTKWRSLTSLGLPIQSVGGRMYYYIQLTSNDLPTMFRFNTIRLRSSAPLVLQDVLWASSLIPY